MRNLRQMRSRTCRTVAHHCAVIARSRDEHSPRPSLAQDTGSLHTFGGIDTFLWNKPADPLLRKPVPRFAFGRSRYDNWLVHEAVAANLRAVIDATEVLATVHEKHSYAHATAPPATSAAWVQNASLGSPRSAKAAQSTPRADARTARRLAADILLFGDDAASRQPPPSPDFWWTLRRSSEDVSANYALAAAASATFTDGLGTTRHTWWVFRRCAEPELANICLARRRRPGACGCEYGPSVYATQTDEGLGGSVAYAPRPRGWLVSAATGTGAADRETQ